MGTPGWSSEVVRFVMVMVEATVMFRQRSYTAWLLVMLVVVFSIGLTLIKGNPAVTIPFYNI